jgi:hypothetical protein
MNGFSTTKSNYSQSCKILFTVGNMSDEYEDTKTFDNRELGIKRFVKEDVNFIK